MYPSIPEALKERNELQSQHHEVSACIFRLKRDFEDNKIDVDRFDDERMRLNGEARELEGKMEVIDAWVTEQRAPAIERERRHQIEVLTREQYIADQKAATARDNLEVQRLAIKAKDENAARQVEIANVQLAIEKEKTARNDQNVGTKQLKDLLKSLVAAVLAEGALQSKSESALRVLAVIADVRRVVPGLVEKVEREVGA